MVVAEPIWQFPDKVYRYLKPVLMVWGRLYRALDLGSPYVILFGQLFRDPVTWWWVNHWMLLCRWMLPSLDPLLIGKAKYQTSLFSQTTWFFTLWDNKPFGGFLGGKLLKLRCAYMCILYTEYISLQSQSRRKNPFMATIQLCLEQQHRLVRR